MSLISVIPFLLTLLCVALLPLIARRRWEPLWVKGAVMLVLSVPIVILLARVDPDRLLTTLHDYFSFICLLGSLFVISGGILLTGDLRATPLVNTGFLLTGALLANIIGTTGASMLLIRPLLQTNSERVHTAHIPIFFIFVVSNIGGCLTPLGDPPLFLGFIRGVPFAWTLSLWPEWLVATASLLAVFFAIDTSRFRREPAFALITDRERIVPLRLRGSANFLGLVAVLALVMFVRSPWREGGMILLSLASYLLTGPSIHRENRFGFQPIKEVAILFLGIFITMAPALTILEARGGALGITRDWHFFWATGVLSSFLDNAPTYLTFSSLALGLLHVPGEGAGPLLSLIRHPGGEAILRAISVGAVFMGANTYIGNGPNFMVKTICEERGYPMPSFFGYMKWSAGILMPLFLAITLIFFS